MSEKNSFSSSTNTQDQDKKQFADLSNSCCQKITDLEHAICGETGEKVALVAYRI